MSRVHSTLLAVGAATLVLVGACAAPAVQFEGAPGPPADLARFYDQQIAFEACAPYATTPADEQLFADGRFDCARVQVPLDYAAPDGPRGEVALLRVEASGERIGSLLVNPGDSGRAPTSTLPGVPDEQAAREVAQRCTDGSGGAQALTSVGTGDVVRDMDVLRAVLGDEKLSYFGASYGSELGAMYAEAFPRNVRAIAIDGAAHPELGAGEHDAMTGVLTGLRVEARWPTVVAGLAEVAAGRGDVLLALRDTIYGRGADGRYAYDTDKLIGISCMDRPRRTPAEQTDLARQLVAAAPILDPGRPVAERYDECAAWPEPPTRSEPWLSGDVDVPPTLIVSVTGDPATPHQGGRQEHAAAVPPRASGHDTAGRALVAAPLGSGIASVVMPLLVLDRTGDVPAAGDRASLHELT